MNNSDDSFWVDFPIVTCPKCEKEFQVDEYYDFSADDSFCCPHCEVPIYIHETDTTMSAKISLTKKAERNNL